MEYLLIVRAEKDMFLDPKVSPDMSCENCREELLVRNRLQLLGRNPGASKPMTLHVCAVAELAGSVRRYFNISLWQQSWEEPEANDMPILQKMVPP